MKLPEGINPRNYNGSEQAATVRARTNAEVLDAARKFQDDAAKVGAPPARYRQSTAYTREQVSVAAGVHSRQANEFNEYYKQQGIIGARHREDGSLVYDSKKAFNDVLKARGLYNRDSSYGDHAGYSV